MHKNQAVRLRNLCFSLAPRPKEILSLVVQKPTLRNAFSSHVRLLHPQAFARADSSVWDGIPPFNFDFLGIST